VVLALATAVAVAATLAFGVGPAAAHICPVPVEIPVGQPSAIDVGVTVEGATVPDVEITIPAGLRLDRVDAKPGWTFTRTGSTVRFRGGPIAAYTCEYFSFGATAKAQGSFGITVVQRTAAGVVVARSEPNPANAQDRALGQIVYAGVRPPAAASGSSGPSAATIAGIALVCLGVFLVGALTFRARRARRLDAEEEDVGADPAGREAELQARLEQFKKRSPGRPPRP
jgi:uncharacterized protein YcnI